MMNDVGKKIETFFGSYKLREYDKSYTLIHADSEPTSILNLVTGQVRQYDINERGEKIVVNVFRPPAFFPMSWAINKTPNQYSFETATNVTLRQAPPERVIKFIKSNPDVLFDLLRRVYLGTDVILRRMAHLMGGSARTRLLYELLLEGRRFGKLNHNGTCVIPMYIYELAARTGLSRETASREITKLKSLGITVSHGAINVNSLKRLQTELGNSL